MTARGVYFAISPEQLQSLLEADSDDDRLHIVTEEIEEPWDEDWLLEVDKAWGAIHRALTDGHLGFDNGVEPLRWAVLGGQQLYTEDDYIMSLLTPDQATALATALAPIDRGLFRERYDAIPADEYGEKCDEDFAYVWESFRELSGFFRKAGNAGRSVLFTADQ